MLRQLLTLLALVSGFGLASTPAVAAQASVVSVAAMAEAGDCQTTAPGPLEVLGTSAATRGDSKPCKPKPIIVWTPTVQLQADRARE